MEVLLSFSVVLGPLLLAAAFLIWWARVTRISWVKWLLLGHAIFWLIVLLAIDIALIWAIENCGGNALYGFQNCAYIRGSTANYAFPSFIFGHVIAIALTAIVVLIAAVAEWRARKAS